MIGSLLYLQNMQKRVSCWGTQSMRAGLAERHRQLCAWTMAFALILRVPQDDTYVW